MTFQRTKPCQIVPMLGTICNEHIPFLNGYRCTTNCIGYTILCTWKALFCFKGLRLSD